MSGFTGDLSTSFAYSEFKPAKSRKKRGNKGLTEQPSTLVLVQRIRAELGQNEWITHCQQLLEASLSKVTLVTPRILCLGLGSPSASTNARVQLGFLLEICERLRVDHTKISIYDPVFVAEDITLFEGLRMRVLTENRKGEYALDAPTICFMPHCDMDLYEMILSSNWSQDQLSNLLFVANRLTDYIENNPVHKLETRVPCLLRITPLLDCRPLPASEMWPTAFNNTSIQIVKLQAFASFSDLPKLPTQSE